MDRKGYRVIVVGIGMVGTRMVEVLLERSKLPVKEIKILATRERYEKVAGRKFKVKKADASEFDGFDIAFFAGTEGASGASKVYGFEAIKRGCIVIDNGKDFRMDKRVPLVVPEVNAEHLKKHEGFVANPNCSTIQAMMVMGPIYKQSKIKRLVVSTYQAVSGSGSKAYDELIAQTKDRAAGRKLKTDAYPVPILGNLIPQISGPVDEMPGYFDEEAKMRRESRKILGDRHLKVSATCVRVPVLNSHAEAMNIQTADKMTPGEVRKTLNRAPGVKVVDDPQKGVWPYPLMADGKDEVFVGRIREDTSAKNCIDLFCVGDNIRKGAALNAIQIAEKMKAMKLI
ncbi:MAG: aspartate-semialdehyde dehydrogenase [bacterium]